MQEEREAEEKSNSEFKNPSSSSSFLRTNGRTHSHTHGGGRRERGRLTAPPFVQWKVKRHTFKLKHSTGDVDDDGRAAPPKQARRTRAETEEEERGPAAETFVTHTEGRGETLH